MGADNLTSFHKWQRWQEVPDFDASKPTIDQISLIYDPVFKALSVGATKATEVIQKDENGRPVKDENNQMVKIQKIAGDPIYDKNLVNIKTFIEGYNRCYDEKVDQNGFYSNGIPEVISISKENHNTDYKLDFEIWNRDIYLSINHKAQDILNMAISTFFSSCQHLYTGGYRSQLLGNIFDPNSIPAFLIFDTPIHWNDEKISDFLPLTRMMVRNIENFDSDDNETKIFFDRAYPDRMKQIFGELITKYTKMEDIENTNHYYFTPDIDINDDEINEPYMDMIGIRRKPFIGVNTKSLY